MPVKNFTVTISPAFEPEKIIEETTTNIWFEFQQAAYIALPRLILTHMRNIINRSTNRARSTGHLAKSMTIWRDPDTKAHIRWGIGHIPTLLKVAPQFYVVNYGKKFTGEPFIPGGGNYRPVMFGNSPVDSALRGKAPKGSPRATVFRKITSTDEHAPSTIANPLNYISKTNRKLEIEVRKLLQKLKA